VIGMSRLITGSGLSGASGRASRRIPGRGRLGQPAAGTGSRMPEYIQVKE